MWLVRYYQIHVTLLYVIFVMDIASCKYAWAACSLCMESYRIAKCLGLAPTLWLIYLAPGHDFYGFCDIYRHDEDTEPLSSVNSVLILMYWLHGVIILPCTPWSPRNWSFYVVEMTVTPRNQSWFSQHIPYNRGAAFEMMRKTSVMPFGQV